MTGFELPAVQPFQLDSVVRSHGWVQLAPFTELVAGGLSYVLRLASGEVIRFEIGEAPGGVRCSATDLYPGEDGELRQLVSWMLGLDQDFSAFYAQAADEPKLAQAAAKARGRVLRSPTVFEDVVKTILTTNTLWGATKRMARNLVELYGDPLPEDPTQHAFPSPERLAQISAEELKEKARLGYRAPYISELAQRVHAGELDLEQFKHSAMDTPALRKELMRIKGVGSYAAANLLMILGRYDHIPIDSWALKMVSQEWYDGASIGPAEVQAAFEQWGEWRGLAYWFWEWREE